MVPMVVFSCIRTEQSRLEVPHIPLDPPSTEGGDKRKGPPPIVPLERGAFAPATKGWMRRVFGLRTAKQVQASRRNNIREPQLRKFLLKMGKSKQGWAIVPYGMASTVREGLCAAILSARAYRAG